MKKITAAIVGAALALTIFSFSLHSSLQASASTSVGDVNAVHPVFDLK